MRTFDKKVLDKFGKTTYIFYICISNALIYCEKAIYQVFTYQKDSDIYYVPILPNDVLSHDDKIKSMADIRILFDVSEVEIDGLKYFCFSQIDKKIICKSIFKNKQRPIVLVNMEKIYSDFLLNNGLHIDVIIGTEWAANRTALKAIYSKLRKFSLIQKNPRPNFTDKEVERWWERILECYSSWAKLVAEPTLVSIKYRLVSIVKLLISNSNKNKNIDSDYEVRIQQLFKRKQ